MRLLFLFSLFIGLTINLQAQDLSLQNPGTPEQRADTLTKKMTADLQLTEEQVPVIYDLNLKYAKQVQTEILDKGASMWSLYTKGQKINKAKEKELKPILSQTQWEAYKVFRKKNRGQMMKNMRG